MAKKTYQEMLKENLAEFDTTQTVDVKGPMLDPILGYEGDGELPTYKDAASVLERYYFGEKRSEHEINEMDYENDKGDSGGKSMKHTEGPSGEEQAGTSNADSPHGSENEKEKDIAKEGKSFSEKEMGTPDLKSANMKDTEGSEGEEQAGTGDTYKEFKKRVVEAIDSIANSITLSEQDHDEASETDEEEKAESKETQEKEKKEGKEPAEHEMKEQSAVPGGPSPKKSGEGEDEDWGEGQHYEESADVTEALENEIIEKIISEMEEIDDEDKEEKEEGEEEGKEKIKEAEGAEEEEEEGKEKEKVGEEEKEEGEEEEEEGEEDEGLDVDKKMEEMVNRLTQGHTEGPSGEEQAGTGGDEKVIPPRKDRSNEGTGEKGTKAMDKSELADA
jgi:hypothetical protein